MTPLILSLYGLIKCLALILLTTTLLAEAAVVHGDAQPTLRKQTEQKDVTDRTVSEALFAELEESARLADIAYCVGTTGIHNPFGCLSHCEDFKGFELITTWNTGPLISDSCGYIALSHPPAAKRIIIAFRGTYSLTNTIIDLSAVPQTYVPYPNDGNNNTSKGSATEPKKCQNCTVHAGFWTSWKTSRDTVLSAVTQARELYPDYEVTLIGHSLGGAVAALASLEMHTRGLDPHVTTFGEPKVGNDKMAGFINEMFNLSSERGVDDTQIRYRRVTHVNDPVPLLPLAEWGYMPHAGEIFVSKLDLPPSREDVEHCTGNADKRCIASSEGNGEEEKVKDFSLLALGIQQQQEILSSSTPSEEDQVRTQWSLVPARYRIWELFFAHRDYFWRIGLCVPGGDPSSWRWA